MPSTALGYIAAGFDSTAAANLAVAVGLPVLGHIEPLSSVKIALPLARFALSRFRPVHCSGGEVDQEGKVGAAS